MTSSSPEQRSEKREIALLSFQFFYSGIVKSVDGVAFDADGDER